MLKLFKALKQSWDAAKEEEKQKYIDDKTEEYYLNKGVSDALFQASMAVSDSKMITELAENGKWETPPNPDYRETINEVIDEAYNELVTAYDKIQNNGQKLAPELREVAALIPSVENNPESMGRFVTQAEAIMEQKKTSPAQTRKHSR